MEFISNFALTAKAIVLHPKQFFDDITWDCGWREPLSFFAVCAGAFSLMLSLVLTFCVNQFAAIDPQIAVALRETTSLGYFAICFAVLFVGAMLGSLLISFFTTVALHFLGGKGSFQRTYLALSCCWIVMFVSWIPLVGWIPALYFFYLAYIALSKAHEIPGWKGLVGLVVGPGCVTLVVGGIMVVATIMQLTSAFNSVNEANHFVETGDPGMREIMDRYRKKESGENE